MKKQITYIFYFFLANVLVVNSQSLKMMTYNIRLDLESDGENRWEMRKDFFVSQLDFFNPDIFGVQEALPNQVKDIEKGLKKYTVIGLGREEGNTGESSSIFFKTEKFQLLEQNTFWLSETPERVSRGWDAACNRVCTYALLKDKKSKKTFYVFNTHLDHLGETARKNGIELILQKIKLINKSNLPLILMGDFNLTPPDERIQMIKKEMLDSREVSENEPFGSVGTFNGFNYTKQATDRIDYIFLLNNNKLKVNKYAVFNESNNLKFASDHFPVYVELKFIK